MAEAAQIQSDDWKDILSAEASPYIHGDDWHDIVPPPVSYDEFAGPKVTETPLYKAGESVQKFGRETFPVSEEERAAHPYASAIGRGTGAMLPAVAATFAAGPAGALAGATQMGMSSGADVFDDALSKGATEEQAERAAGATGALSAAIGVLPLGSILAPIRQKLPGLAGWAMAKLTQAAVNGVTFATVGKAQQWLTTEIEKAYYDPNAKYDPQVKDMLASFIVGGAFGTMHPLHRPGEAPGRPAEAPPLEGEVLPPERGVPPAGPAVREAPIIEGEAVRPTEEGRPAGLPEPARALPPPAESAPAATPPPLQAYESLPQEQIRNPVTGTPEEKIAQLGKLTAENKPIIQDLMKDIDDRFGTRSSDNVKTDENILAKSQRPSIIAKKPWFGVEYVRDSYRFKTLMDSLFDVPDIVDMLKERGINVVKSDVVKQFHPGELGWRISAFDLQMPNGQLVEYYLPVKEMEFAKDEGHEIFEKWRNLDLKKLTPDQISAYENDILRSRDIYQNAWNAYLARTGDDPRALRAALSKIEASPSGTIRNVPLNVSSAEKAIPGSQAPLTRDAAQPELSTSTSPDSSRTTVATSSSSKDNISDARHYDNQGVDLPTRSLLDKKGVPYTVEDFHPNDIKADPARFQFRSAADEKTGETEEHAIPPEKWKGQHTPLLAWRDSQGQAWIVDGHHRLAISKRLVKNNPDIRLKAVVLNEAHLTATAAKNFGKTRNEVRDAYRNLARGTLDPKLGERTLRYIRDLLDIEKTGFRLSDQSPQETHAPDLFGPSAGIPHRVTAADGRTIDVHPIVVEADRPITSQDKGYDAALQPRQRDRAASQAQVRDIATNLDPERLGYSAEADRGAPIIGSDGMVESGNGRVLALRRAYEQGGPQAKAYRNWLAQQGVDVSKFRNPIMVRRRLTPLTPDQRREFTVAANQPTTLSMSAPERAMADSRLIDAKSLNLITNPDDLSRNAALHQGFPLFKTPSGWEAAEGRGEPQGEKIRIGRDTYAYVNPKYTAKQQEIADAVKDIGVRMAPKAQVKGVSALRSGGERTWGAFINNPSFPQLIAWSLERGEAGKIGQTVRHEIVHHLRNMGLFKPEEWKALRDAAVNDGWLQKHDIYNRYADLPADTKIEEAVAEQFGKWRAERSLVKPGLIRDAFMRLDLFLRRVAAAVRKALGFNATPSDVFTRIETGEVGRREPGTGKVAAMQQRDEFPKELYHIAGPRYKEGEPLKSLYRQYGDRAYDIAARRWPDLREAAQDHAHKTFFYDSLSQTELHTKRGKLLKVDPTKVDGLHRDPVEGFWTTREDVDPEAISVVSKRASGGRVDTRKASHYSPTRGTRHRHCSTCTMFSKPNSCSAVSGIIAKWGLCDWFEAGKEKMESYADWRERIGWANGGAVAERASGGRIVAHSIDHNPTEAQKEAGNYRHGHITVHGLDVSIEGAKGSERAGIGKDGKPWRCVLPAAYGYIRGTTGADSEHVDVYVGPHRSSKKVFVVDQHDADTKAFDEHKVILAAASEKQARDIYHRGFSDGRGKERLGHLTEMSIDRFKHWLSGDTEIPVKGTAHAPKIDTSHDVRWLSEMSKDGTVFYRDRSLPKMIRNNGKMLDVDEPLLRHETEEYAAIKKMVAELEQKHGREPNDAEREDIYHKAHVEHGLSAENAWLRSNGYDADSWQKWCAGQLAHLEHKRMMREPQNVHVRLSPHDRRKLEATL